MARKEDKNNISKSHPQKRKQQKENEEDNEDRDLESGDNPNERARLYSSRE